MTNMVSRKTRNMANVALKDVFDRGHIKYQDWLGKFIRHERKMLSRSAE